MELFFVSFLKVCGAYDFFLSDYLRESGESDIMPYLERTDPSGFILKAFSFEKAEAPASFPISYWHSLHHQWLDVLRAIGEVVGDK